MGEVAMKNNKNIFFAVMIGIGTLYHSVYGLSDSSVVDSIKAVSDLTQSDADRWKFLWLGGLAEPGALGASAYGMYKAYYAGKSIAPSQNSLDKILTNEWYLTLLGGRQPSERLQSWVTSKGAWASAGALGAGVVAYKVLYPRVQAGLLKKIQNYVGLCSQLAVANNWYSNVQEYQHAIQQPGNTVWAVSNSVAVDDGFANLIGQGKGALLLLDQLLSSPGSIAPRELDSLRQSVLVFVNNLNYNRQFIQSALRNEKQRRASERTEYGKELDVQGKAAKIQGQHIKNVETQWRLLKDVVKTAKEYGPSIAAGIAFITGWNWLTSPSTQTPQQLTGAYGSTAPWDQR